VKLKIITIALLLFALFSCEFRKSVNKDLITGLTTQGDGLSCDNVYLSDGEDKISRNSFIYGEKIYLNFENIEGFMKEEDFTFPGMQMFVVKKSGDTVMQHNDLYADDAEGINFSPLVLNANLTIARPMVTNNNYTLYVTIWDKKGEGTFKAEMDFEVVSNDQIIIESNNVSYDNIYLFSAERKKAITDNKIKYNENVYMIFEGLSGFREEGGKVFPGLGMKATDSGFLPSLGFCIFPPVGPSALKTRSKSRLVKTFVYLP